MHTPRAGGCAVSSHPRHSGGHRRAADPARRRAPRHRARSLGSVGGELHRQVRHQDARCPRPADPATQAPSPDQPAALLRPLQTDDAHRLAPGQPASRERSPHAPLCSCPRLGRALPDQIAPLLRHLRHAPPSPPRAPQNTSATPTANTTPGDDTLDDTVVLIIKTWSYCDPRHNHLAGPDLALALAARAREHEQAEYPD